MENIINACGSYKYLIADLIEYNAIKNLKENIENNFINSSKGGKRKTKKSGKKSKKPKHHNISRQTTRKYHRKIR